MRILITGSSGQIGANLGLYLQNQGHQVFGVDRRPNIWTDQIETLIQDLSTPYKDFAGGIGDYKYPPDLDVVVHLAAHAKVHELVKHPDHALENIIMVYNVLEFCRQKDLPIYGRDKMLDFTYIDDCIDGITRGIGRLVRGEVANQTINLAYGQGNSLVQMAEYIGEALGVEPKMTIEPSLRGEVTHYIADISKAKTLLGYNPTTPLREGIRKAVVWSKGWEESDG